jgi:predicted Rossmann-fold nucleotide-binding protein
MEREERTAGRRVLVCGGGDYQDWLAVAGTLRRARDSSPIGLIIHGCDPGAATLAVRWARVAGVPTSGFDADFRSHGPAAERLRNERMIVESKPDLVIAFPGGEGTADLVSRAKVAGVPVEQAYRTD